MISGVLKYRIVRVWKLRPVQYEAPHVFFLYSYKTKFYLIYHRDMNIFINVTTDRQNSLTFTPPTNSLLQFLTTFLWHATQLRAFFAKKMALGYK